MCNEFDGLIVGVGFVGFAGVCDVIGGDGGGGVDDNNDVTDDVNDDAYDLNGICTAGASKTGDKFTFDVAAAIDPSLSDSTDDFDCDRTAISRKSPLLLLLLMLIVSLLAMTLTAAGAAVLVGAS